MSLKFQCDNKAQQDFSIPFLHLENHRYYYSLPQYLPDINVMNSMKKGHHVYLNIELDKFRRYYAKRTMQN